MPSKPNSDGQGASSQINPSNAMANYSLVPVFLSSHPLFDQLISFQSAKRQRCRPDVHNENDIARPRETSLDLFQATDLTQFVRCCTIQINTGINRVFHISITNANCSRAIGSTPAICGARLNGVFCAYSTAYFLLLAAIPTLAPAIGSWAVSVEGATVPLPRLVSVVHSALGTGLPPSSPTRPLGELRWSRLSEPCSLGHLSTRLRMWGPVRSSCMSLLPRLLFLGRRFRFTWAGHDTWTWLSWSGSPDLEPPLSSAGPTPFLPTAVRWVELTLSVLAGPGGFRPNILAALSLPSGYVVMVSSSAIQRSWRANWR
jgi:hypothetical protein